MRERPAEFLHASGERVGQQLGLGARRPVQGDANRVLGRGEPVGEQPENTNVGTVWLPPLTFITSSAADSSRSMSTSSYSMPSRCSWALSRTQYPHQVVVYIVKSGVMVW
jgi:hypothetical protein